MSRPETLCEAFAITAAKSPDTIALRSADGSVEISWREYRTRVRSIAAGLAGLGLSRGDTVALMMTNRPEFHLVDTAALHAGAIPFSVYNTNPVETISHQFANSEAQIVLCDSQFLEVVREAAKRGGTVRHVVCVDGPQDGAPGLDEIEAAPDPDFDFDTTWQAVEADDPVTIVYTSGTTGTPKGVELSHRNVLASVWEIRSYAEVGLCDRTVSYLPDAHVANRGFAHYANHVFGIQITTVADMTNIATTFANVRPTLFLGVPRVWVKLKGAIEAAFTAEPNALKRSIATWAIDIGRQRARRISSGTSVGPWLAVQHAVADRLVLSVVRTKIGLDQLRVGVTGAAAIPRDVHEFVLALGLPVCEGYGMSECALATCTPPNRIKIGSVGPAVPGVEICIADDGEVLIKGDNVMRGYRGAPELTAEVIDRDGYLHSGDIGEIDADGYLRIVDRKKEMIITQTGKNISPTQVENAVITDSNAVGQIIAIGEQRPYLTALIVLDPEGAAAVEGSTAATPAQLAADPAVRAAVQAGIDAANRTLPRVAQIKRFQVVPDTWEIGSQFLTPTGKLKRKAIVAHYADAIEEMYR